MEKKWITEMDIARGLSISFVVLIHTLNIPIMNSKPPSVSYWGFNLLQAFIQFAVPCFILISSIMVSYHLKSDQIKLLPFYQKKLVKMVVPYLLWTAIFLAFQVLLNKIPLSSLLSVKHWLFWLFCGKAYTHLYFMSIIIQFYLLAPLLVKLVYATRTSLSLTLLINMSIQVGIYWVNKLYIYPVFPYPATLFIWYWCISTLGLWIGFNYAKWTTYINKYWPYILACFIALTSIYLYYKVQILSKVKFNTFYYQMTWYVFVILASILILHLSLKLDLLQNKMAKALTWVGELSFGIYMIHPLLTLLLSRIIKFSNPMLLSILTLVMTVGIIGFCGFIVILLQGNKVTSILFGRYKKINRSSSSSTSIKGEL